MYTLGKYNYWDGKSYWGLPHGVLSNRLWNKRVHFNFKQSDGGDVRPWWSVTISPFCLCSPLATRNCDALHLLCRGVLTQPALSLSLQTNYLWLDQTAVWQRHRRWEIAYWNAVLWPEQLSVVDIIVTFQNHSKRGGKKGSECTVQMGPSCPGWVFASTTGLKKRGTRECETRASL